MPHELEPGLREALETARGLIIRTDPKTTMTVHDSTGRVNHGR